ncbi:MAG: hypothetical protein HYZ83_01215 [Candidatus Omnitrophica bacterium]|nr:hypothetical protein [Candidatus Omnitrophota bacterium]
MKAVAYEFLKEEHALTREDIEYLKRIEKATFLGVEKLFDPATGLPVDIASIAQGNVLILPENTYYSKTSPTNIGLGFLYLILAKERRHWPESQAYEYALRMMNTLEKLETHEGFLYNWYYLSGKEGTIPQVTLDRFVSSLDNGDLDVCLMAAAGAFPQTELSERIDRFLKNKNYDFFFNKNPNQPNNGMINTGYDAEKKIYQGADYAILNTEGRMTVLEAILKDNIPETAWKKQTRLVRTYTTLENEIIAVVAPWGGSLYETLFADEILGGDRIAPKAFRQNALHMIRIHQDKGKRISESGIWGFSNGEVPGENRYEMAGVPEIAYNRFPGEFVTIYSSFLSLRYHPKAVANNLRRIEELNPQAFDPAYGFTDSIAPKTGIINRNILALDKGIELLCIANFMNSLEGKKKIPDFFWEYAKSKGWESEGKTLIQEEENHPSFHAIINPQSYNIRPEKQGLPSLDLIEMRQDAGVFYEPDRAKVSVAWLNSDEKKAIIQMQYDVSQRYTYAGMFIHYDDLDISDYHSLSLQVKGDEVHGYPETLKVELKWRGNYVQFEHVPLKSIGTEIKIPLFGNNQKIDEIALVIENAAAGKNKKGKIFIESLSLQSGADLQG